MDFALQVNINQIDNVEFKSSQEASLKSEVLALAVSNAKLKGKSLANAFGASLGRIYNINSSSNHFQNAYGANRGIERIGVSAARELQRTLAYKFF